MINDFEPIYFKKELNNYVSLIESETEKAVVIDLVKQLMNRGDNLPLIYFLLKAYSNGKPDNIANNKHLFLNQTKLRESAEQSLKIYEEKREIYINEYPDYDYSQRVSENCDAVAINIEKLTPAEVRYKVYFAENGEYPPDYEEAMKVERELKQHNIPQSKKEAKFSVANLSSAQREELAEYPTIAVNHFEPHKRALSLKLGKDEKYYKEYILTATQLLQALVDNSEIGQDNSIIEKQAEELWNEGYPVYGWTMADEYDYCALFRGEFKQDFMDARTQSFNNLKNSVNEREGLLTKRKQR